MANAQLAHLAGLSMGRSPPPSRDIGLLSMAICTSVLNAQESAPLLAEGNTSKCFPKNNEQDYFKSLLRYNFLELFLNHIR